MNKLQFKLVLQADIGEAVLGTQMVQQYSSKVKHHETYNNQDLSKSDLPDRG